VFWISSHSRTKAGKEQPRRHRFFATRIVPGAVPRLQPVGRAYEGLLADLQAAATLAGLGLKEAATRKPEEPGGLNIEGLAATPQGQLLIGFRNPLQAGGKALLVPLLNPRAVIDGQAAVFGQPILLPLGERGIRSIDAAKDGYFISAGPVADSGGFALFHWSGKSTDAPLLRSDLKPSTLFGEALLVWPDGKSLQMLSDDGAVVVNGSPCSSLPSAEQRFRSLTWALP
jgi:hypothetical protein